MDIPQQQTKFSLCENFVCDYCNQPTINTDCLDKRCCVECWEYMKDWTLEKQEELDKLSKEVSEQLREWDRIERPKILAENGLPPDSKLMVCSNCRKVVNTEGGLWYCDCVDERTGKNNEYSVPIPERFMKNPPGGF